MLEVAVIGAGAAGLVASRHLLGHGLRPSIFEAAKTLGGAWAASSSASEDERNPNSKMWNGLTTNLSKHTCRFSEFPWPEESTPTFPTATDMHQYLVDYSEQFLSPDCFQYECQVTGISLLPQNGYRVEWTDLSTQSKHSKDFEGVVVATGFFSKPLLPKGLQVSSDNNIAASHSADYVSHTDFANETVAVLGCSFSALEIAVDVSQSAKRVVSVLPRIPWVIPRFIPHPDPQGTTVLPIDLEFYQRAQDGPQLPETTTLSVPMNRARNDYLKSILGRRQEMSPIGIPSNFDKPPMVAISDYYLDLVMDGSIDVIKGGRLKGVDPNTGLQIESPNGEWVLPNITKVICCTGYGSNLDEYMDQSILDILEYDANDSFCPMTLCWDTLHPKLANLAFCGMYRGPYMGVMELQGRLAAGVMSGKVNIDDETYQTALGTSKEIRGQDLDSRPQFPHPDYIGFMDSLAANLNENFPKHNMQKGDMVSPAFYQENEELVLEGQNDLQKEAQKGKDGGRMSSLVLSALIGSWKFHRNIVHRKQDRTEQVYGTIQFSRDKSLDHVLYREDGFYELSPSKVLPVFREYEYQIQDDNVLEIYFVESGKRALLFLSLKFTRQDSFGYWIATSDHLCIKDLYSATFKIKLDGTAATEIIMSYRVKGPAKDYESTTVLTPGQPTPK